jgi:uncharacterized membrane protein YesL
MNIENGAGSVCSKVAASGSKGWKMTEIDIDEANEVHGISTFHNKQSNGEKRFRLKKSDGTAYIRTESGNEGAWQESHFHNRVMETYIVQSGWIAYAEDSDTRIKLSIHKRGDKFTTKPGTVHNVYMAANSVIHTVKHGDCGKDDRRTESTEAFNSECLILDSETKIRQYAAEAIDHADQKKILYSGEYQHFDKLIWQAPAWATAIFALAIGSLGAENLDRFANNTSITNSSIEVIFLVIVSLTLFCFSYVMFRFRVHQRNLKKYKPTPFVFSASSLTQLLLNVQATFLLMLALSYTGVPLITLWLGAPLMLFLITWRGHKFLNRENRKIF